jgi:uncharacterized protein YbjT (DUF2867 family)
VIAVSRRRLAIAHPKLEVVLTASPDHAEDLGARLGPPAERALDTFCALGTTIARAGSQDAFRAIDLDVVVRFAEIAKDSGARCFVLVSSVGADAASSNFYLRVKGEAEAAVAGRRFEAVHILRPGLLLGDRQESRPAEAIARALAPMFNPMLVAGLRRCRAISASVVGAAMVGAALGGAPGTHVLHYDEIRGAASSLE